MKIIDLETHFFTTEYSNHLRSRTKPPRETVVKATEGVCASFEICDARIKDWKYPYPDFFADNGLSARVVLSGKWPPASGERMLVPTEEEQRILVTIHDQRKQGMSLREIARELQENGIPTKRGQISWYPPIVSQILRREAA